MNSHNIYFKKNIFIIIPSLIILSLILSSCESEHNKKLKKDREIIENRQEHFYKKWENLRNDKNKQ